MIMEQEGLSGFYENLPFSSGPIWLRMQNRFCIDRGSLLPRVFGKPVLNEGITVQETPTKEK
jgi:hypothetical protein